jgi:transcriptional regulator with XRE-family HTH domain
MANHLRALREQVGISQAELAELMGTTRSQIAKLERGERRLTEKWIDRAATALGVPPGRIIEIVTVPLVGFVGAGAALFPFNHEAGDHIGDVEAPPGASNNVVAVQVKGDSMRGIADEGWLLYYDSRQEPVTDELLGHLCVVGLSDGRVLVKKLQRGHVPGHFHLYSSNSDPIFDQEIDWAAKVTWIKPY